jgi:hypothetical protein
MFYIYGIPSMAYYKASDREYKPCQKAICRLLFPALLMAVIMLFVQSCSSTPKNLQSGRSGNNLKKQICITRFEDKKRFDDAYLERPFQDRLVDTLLASCKKPTFIIPGQSEFPMDLDPVPKLESGMMDNMAIADIGRQNGFNAVVTGAISDIRQSDEISWLTGEHSYFQVAVTIAIYDTQTGAKLLDKTYLHEIEVDVDQASESEKESEYFDIIAIEKLLKLIVKDMNTDICKTVSGIPWQGFIIATEGDAAVISAGKKVGLKAGNHLYIYKNDQILNGDFGNRYRVPGAVVGELELISVSDDQSKAILVDGTGAVPGNSVSLK